MNQEVFAAVADALERGEPAALVTIVAAHGSTPQRVGAKMLVFADGRPKVYLGRDSAALMLSKDAQNLSTAALNTKATNYFNAIGPVALGTAVTLAVGTRDVKPLKRVLDAAEIKRQLVDDHLALARRAEPHRAFGDQAIHLLVDALHALGSQEIETSHLIVIAEYAPV